MKWITRQNINVDRVACPWLIRRFIDPQAQFLFVEENQLLESAARENAIPFDAPRLSEVKQRPPLPQHWDDGDRVDDASGWHFSVWVEGVLSAIAC